METKDVLFLKPLLGERVVGSQGSRQDRRYDEGQNVETVQQALLKRSLSKKGRYWNYTFWSTLSKYPISDPHVERVGHADKTKSQEDVDGFQKVLVELEI